MQTDEKMTLEELKSKYQKIAGAWNGKDRIFTCEGETYVEEQANIAGDIVDAVDNVINLIETFNF